MLLERKKILVTGAAGFIGAALVRKLLQEKAEVVGIDNINDYYSKELKLARLKIIEKNKYKNNGVWHFYKTSLENIKSIKEICSSYDFDVIVHLAAQAGVRYSLINPQSYIDSNLVGFGNILEICREKDIKNFIFASSSSVYGGNKITPFNEDQKVDYPVSLYAATKKANEVLAHSYSHLYNIPTTGLRFFTVYGPWGRPDMAPMIFIKSILKNEPIKVFNNGLMRRDFTYIDDVVEGILRCCFKPASSDDHNEFSSAPYRIFNIGNGKPIELLQFIDILEKKLNLKAIKNFQPIQQGDVIETFADTKALANWIKYSPKTKIEDGLDKFVDWYKKYYCKLT